MFADQALARRLERAEATANIGFVEARAKLVPEAGAEWIEVAGAYAMYDGPQSPCTQTFGLGLFAMPTEPEMDHLEAFFQHRLAPVFNEVSPLAGKELTATLTQRGYRPYELSNVLYLPLEGRDSPVEDQCEEIQTRVVAITERDAWSKTAAEGWSEVVEFADTIGGLMRVAAANENITSFLAERDGTPIASGSLAIHDGVALLAGASTIAKWRNRGAQRALFTSRIEYAARAGCDVVMVVGEPGGPTQRNAERQGFRVAYTRIKWKL